jgi:hypothetical protein
MVAPRPAEPAALGDALAAAVRLGPVADRVAEAPELVRLRRGSVGQHGLERVIVPVDV